MKKTILLVLLLTITFTTYAQLGSNGFYRVQNTTTGRYVKVADNRGSLNYQAATADVGAIRTIRDFEKVVSDPGTIIYIELVSDPSNPRYDLKAQGTGMHDIIDHYVQIKESRKGGTYQCFATAYGQTAYIADEYYLVGGQEGVFEEVGVLDPKETKTREWYIHPVSQDDGKYFGITPEWNDGTTYYATFYAGFPFSFHSEGMKAYYICSIDYQYGIAVWKEVEGDIPASMPVIVTSKANGAANNRLDIHLSDAKPASDNLLRGVYFDLAKGPHANRVAYDPATMRVFGQLADGSMGYKKADIKYIPANTAYLPVPEGTADELKVMTVEEYDDYLASLIDTVTIRVNDVTKVYGQENPQFTYTLENAPEGVTIETLLVKPTLTTTATKTSDVGTYAITASGAEMTNCYFVYVDGTLTVTEASVTVRVNNASKVYGEENPPFTYRLENAPEGVTIETLETKPTLTTEATKYSDVGTYAIKASGAEMKNCVFVYIDGTLTIQKAKQYLECEVFVGEQKIEGRDITVEVGSHLRFTFSYIAAIECHFSNEEIFDMENGLWVGPSLHVDAIKEGSSTITFSLRGDNNVEAAPDLVYNVTTIVSGIQNAFNVNDNKVYDLLGRKVENASKLKGIYIVNGRKVIF